MRILQIHNSYRNLGGEDSVVRSDAALLRAAGHDVVEYMVANPPGRLGAVGALAVSSWNPISARQLAEIADRTKPDIAHVHNTWYRASPSVLGTLRKKGIGVVMTVHNFRLMCANGLLYRNGAPCTDCVGTHPWRGVVHRCYRDSFVASTAAVGSIAVHRLAGTWSRYVDRFVVATDFLGDMLATTGLPAERIRRIPISVLDPGTRPQPPSASTTVLLVGRMDAQKGTRELLELWRLVHHNLELRVIGDGADRSSLEAMQVPNVRFTGWMEPEELRSEMLAARALVFPSALLETFGLGMVEAFAAGVPVVANDVGTRAEVVGRDGAGWLMKDRSDWKQALTMLGDDAAVDQAGVLARQRYVERFDPEVTLPQLVQVYEELVAKQKLG